MPQIEPKSRRSWGTLLRLGLPLGAMALYLASLLRGPGAPPGWLAGEMPSLGLALLTYSLAHGLRAVRLAVIAAPVLSLRARTLFFLHFHVAPLSVAVPFKLGELYRLQQLAVLGKDWGRALLVILLERAFDAIALIVLCGALVLVDREMPPHLLLTAVVLTVAMGATVFVFVVAGPGLRGLQDYIFRNHVSPQACFLLKAIASFRQAIDIGHQCLRGNFHLFLLLSIGIWGCEGATLAALAPDLAGGAGAFLTGIITMALLPETLSQLTGWPYRLYVVTAVLVLFLAWPVATVLYLRRLADPRQGSAARADCRPLSSVRPPRRVRLQASGRLTCPSR